MRKVNEKRPEVAGMFLMLTPPMSSDVQVFSGGLIAVRRGASAIGPTVDEGWLTLPPVGEASGESVLGSTGAGLSRLGFVIGIADFATVRDAIAFALALWWGDRDARLT